MDVSILIVAGIVFAIGAGTWLYSIKVHRAHVAWLEGKTRAIGTVTRLSRRYIRAADGPGDEESVSKVPIVKFRAANGGEYEVDAPDAPATIGAEVEVAYDPALPSDGRGVVRVKKVGCSVMLIVIAAALVVVALTR